VFTVKIHLTFDIIKMSLGKLSDRDVKMLIELWKNESSLLVMTFPKYSNENEQKAALSNVHGPLQSTLSISFAAWFPHTPPHTGASAPVDFPTPKLIFDNLTAIAPPRS